MVKFFVEIIYKLVHPTITFIVFLTVVDENIILISWDDTCHIAEPFCQSYKRVGYETNKNHPPRN
jgi:hypothetical protein